MNFVKKMAQELTHRTIQDGWFREISDTMWPGQAMALRVKKILHVEQSKYQDVSGSNSEFGFPPATSLQY